MAFGYVQMDSNRNFWNNFVQYTNKGLQSSLTMELRVQTRECRTNMRFYDQTAESWLGDLETPASANHLARTGSSMMGLASFLWGDGTWRIGFGAWESFGSN